MTYTEIQGDLFQHLTRDNYHHELDYKEGPFAVYAHCIANDGKYGAGIAPIFIDKVFQSGNFVKMLLAENPWDGKGWCLFISHTEGPYGFKVFEANLITKKSTYGKPTYDTVREALQNLKLDMVESHCSILRMPKIGSGLDKLEWPKVSEIVQEVFGDTDINIEVYYL